MPELRVDPLTGDKVIVAAERASRPGGGLARRARPAGRPRAPTRSSRATRTARRPRCTRCAPAAARRTRPGWTVRVGAQPVPGAGSRRAPTAAPRPTPTCSPPRPAPASTRSSSTARRRSRTLAELAPSRSPPRWRSGASGCARTPTRAYVHLIVNERREAGASLPHTHAQLYALGFVPAAVARERERFGAYATRTMGSNLLGDLVQEEVKRRERLVGIDDEAVLLAPYGSRLPYQLTLAPRRPRAPLRGRRADRGRAAARRARPAGAPARARARRSTCGCARRHAAPSTSAGGSTSCPGSTTSPGSSSGPASS